MIAVVGAAILSGDRVLAARRTGPPAAAGRWELPGGKVEPGESPGPALVREIAEELGCTVEILGWLAGAVDVDGAHRLTVATARLLEGTPVALADHDAVRWLSAGELGEVDWLEADRPFVAQLAELLTSPD